MLLGKVKELCADRKMTLKELSDISGVPYTAMKEWDDHVPGALAVWKVAKALNVPVTDLLHEIENG